MKRRNGVTMAERVAATPAGEQRTELQRQRDPQEVHGHHCWVTDPIDGSEGRPGLAVEWRTRPDGGQDVLVTYLAGLRDGWVTVREWLPAPLVCISSHAPTE